MSEPDLNFDVDALFDHMIENLGHSSDDELEWLFSFEGGTAESLRSIAKSLPHEFIPDVAEELEQVDEEGNLTIGGPVLSLTTQGKFDRSEIKSLTARMKQIALDNNLTYLGVDCFETQEDAELAAWLSIEEASWRLRHMTDAGLGQNEDMPWSFLFDCPSVPQMHKLSSCLGESGFEEQVLFDEPDSKNNFGLCLLTRGRNCEAELRQFTEKLEAIAGSCESSLSGIQFFSSEILEFLESKLEE